MGVGAEFGLEQICALLGHLVLKHLLPRVGLEHPVDIVAI